HVREDEGTRRQDDGDEPEADVSLAGDVDRRISGAKTFDLRPAEAHRDDECRHDDGRAGELERRARGDARTAEIAVEEVGERLDEVRPVPDQVVVAREGDGVRPGVY